MHSNTIPLIAIDAGKNVHAIAVYRAAGDGALTTIIEPTDIHTTQKGLRVATAIIDQMLADHTVVKLGHEPTANYYQAWAYYFMDRYADEIAAGRLIYQFVNTYTVKQARTTLMKGRYRKTDAIDTAAIARCMWLGEGVNPAYLADEQTLRFEQWAAEHREVDKMRRRLGRVVRSQFDRLWPNALVNVKRFKKAHPNMEAPEPIVETDPLSRKTVQAILTHCPNPHDVRLFTEDEMIEFLREHIGSGGVVKARRVLRVAYNGVLPPPNVAQILAERLSHDWEAYRLYDARIEVLKATADALVPHSPAAMLPSIPGVSNYLAARYLAGIRDISRFETPQQIWAFAGFDPNLDASGDTKRIGKISKRGDPAFRDALYLIGSQTANHCPSIKRVYKRAFQRYSGTGRHTAATIHAANAANRMIFCLLVEQRPYLPSTPRRGSR